MNMSEMLGDNYTLCNLNFRSTLPKKDVKLVTKNGVYIIFFLGVRFWGKVEGYNGLKLKQWSSVFSTVRMHR